MTNLQSGAPQQTVEHFIQYCSTIKEPIDSILSHIHEKINPNITIQDIIKRSVVDILFGVKKHYFNMFLENQKNNKKIEYLPTFGVHKEELILENKQYIEQSKKVYNINYINHIQYIDKTNENEYYEVDKYLIMQMFNNTVRTLDIVSRNLPMLYQQNNESLSRFYGDEEILSSLKNCLNKDGFRNLNIYLLNLPHCGKENKLLKMIYDNNLLHKVKFFLHNQHINDINSCSNEKISSFFEKSKVFADSYKARCIISDDFYTKFIYRPKQDSTKEQIIFATESTLVKTLLYVINHKKDGEFREIEDLNDIISKNQKYINNEPLNI